MPAKLHALVAVQELRAHPNGTYDLLGIVNGFNVVRFPLSGRLHVVTMWTGIDETVTTQRCRFILPDGVDSGWVDIAMPQCPDPRYIVTNHWRFAIELRAPGQLRIETEAGGGGGSLELPILQKDML